MTNFIDTASVMRHCGKKLIVAYESLKKIIKFKYKFALLKAFFNLYKHCYDQVVIILKKFKRFEIFYQQ